MKKEICLNKKDKEKNCSCSEDYCKNYGIYYMCIRYHIKNKTKPDCIG
ncbi:MAG: hypothetical protein QW117_01860 [Candidatus Pacearchaeota archaeon]